MEITPLMDAAPLEYYQQASTLENEEGQQYTTESVRGMLSSGAKTVVLSTKY